MPAVVDEHAGVDQRDAGDLPGIGRRPGERERAAEIVGDQVDPREPELIYYAGQVGGVAGHGVVVVAVLVGPAEAGHVRCHHLGELGDPCHQGFPVAAGSGVAVHKHDRLARLASAADQHW